MVEKAAQRGRKRVRRTADERSADRQRRVTGEGVI